MNQSFVRFALLLGLLAPFFGSLRAQEGPPSEQYEPPPPVGVDVDYFAPPKSTLSVGFRTLTGPKVKFAGRGTILSKNNPGDPNDSSITSRTYDDGRLDASTGLDAFGNATTIPANTTNNWAYNNSSQITADGNGVTMHTYSATITGNNPQSGKADTSSGFELTLERDFGWHIGRLQIDLFAGFGLNDIHYILTKPVPADVTTLTDTFSTYNTVLDANGDPVLDANGNHTYQQGTAQTAPYAAPSSTTDTSGNAIDNSTLLDSQPNQNTDPSNPNPSRQQSTVHTTNEVTDQWHIKGAYFTIRAGPKVTLPITEKFQASVSAGPALVYAGTTFSVTQTINSPSANVSNTITDGYSTLLPAYFADATIEYWLTDRAGFYAGATFQSSTSYNQSIHSGDGAYTTKIDLTSEQGMRMGVNFKF